MKGIYLIFFDDTQSSLNYKTKNQEFIKKEIDICIFDSSKNEKYAIELKFPNNGQVPEQMFSFIRDIKFMEQLREFGFTETYCICLVNNSDFYDVKDKMTEFIAILEER